MSASLVAPLQLPDQGLGESDERRSDRVGVFEGTRCAGCHLAAGGPNSPKQRREAFQGGGSHLVRDRVPEEELNAARDLVRRDGPQQPQYIQCVLVTEAVGGPRPLRDLVELRHKQGSGPRHVQNESPPITFFEGCDLL